MTRPASTQALEIRLGVGTVESCRGLLQRASNAACESVVITLEGVDPRGDVGDMAGMALSQEQLLRVFQTLTSSLAQLRHVRLEWNMIDAHLSEQQPILTTTALAYLLRHASLLQSLSLYRVHVAGDDAAFRRLTEEVLSHHTTLHTVRLEFCAPLNSPNLDAMVTSFATVPFLRWLEVIGFQGDSSRGCTSASLQTLGKARHLKSLKIWGGMLQRQDPYAMVHLAAGFVNTGLSSLQDLELGLFRLDVRSAEALANLLRTTTTLDRIWLDVNTPLDLPVVEPLTNAMKQNTSITSFNLVSTANQDASPQVLQVFVDMARVNVTLRHCTLRCSRNQPPADSSLGDDTLQFYLKLNRVGRQRLLANTKSRQQWLMAMMGASDETSVIYYLLSRNPTFISQSMGPTNKRKMHPENDTTTPTLPPSKRSKPNPMVSP